MAAEKSVWQQMVDDMNSGVEVRIDKRTADYWLEGLPPIHMNYTAKFKDGTERRVWFGFAEGYELVTACWPDPNEEGMYFIQQTTEINPYAF